MLLQEFIDRTGFEPSIDYYHTVIEPEYNCSKLDKDAWCKQWKKNGGIQKAYNAPAEQAVKVVNLENDVKKLEKKNNELNANIKGYEQTLDMANDAINALKEEKETLMYVLLNISEKHSSEELREIVINAIGFKKYISYKFEHDMAIWQLDRDEIVSRMK